MSGGCNWAGDNPIRTIGTGWDKTAGIWPMCSLERRRTGQWQSCKSEPPYLGGFKLVNYTYTGFRSISHSASNNENGCWPKKCAPLHPPPKLWSNIFTDPGCTRLKKRSRKPRLELVV